MSQRSPFNHGPGNIFVTQFLEKIDYPTITFFAGLFLIVGAMEHAGLLKIAAATVKELSGGNSFISFSIILWVSAFGSSIVDNVPFAATLAPKGGPTMRIRDVMTKDPITVDSETLILDARKIMKENHIRRLPVVEEGKLVGIVTKQDLDEAAPAPTNSTSAYDFHYSLSKMKAREVMKKDLVILTPDTPLEEALKIGQQKRIGSFLVVEEGRLVGITTESDLLRFLIRALGLEEEGSRMTIEGLGGKLSGDLLQIISIIEKNKTILLSMLSLPRPEKKDWMIVLRVKSKETDVLVDDLRSAGFNVTYVA